MNLTSMAPGIYISEPDPNNINQRARAVLLSIINTHFDLTTTLSRQFLSGLPDEICIEVEELIDVSHERQEEKYRESVERKDDPLYVMKPLDEKAVLNILRTIEPLIAEEGFKVNVVMPAASAAAQDDVTIAMAKMIQNAMHDGKHRVVLLRGATGIGKTERIRAACKAAGVPDDKVGYFSMPTLQPEDFSGIPAPDPDNSNHFKYRTLATLTNYEIFVLDEFNRTHDKVHNAVMQLMLERKINDTEFNNIKVIFLAINPSDDPRYQGTYELDLAVQERIDHYIDIVGVVNPVVIAKNLSRWGINEGLARDAAEIGCIWYNDTLSDSLRQQLNPRRLEKILFAHLSGEDIHTTVDKKRAPVPLQGLLDMLAKKDVLTLDTLLANPLQVESIMKAVDSPEAKKRAYDTRDRFVELMDRLYRARKGEDYVKVAYLFAHIAADKVPSAKRNRAQWRWVQRQLVKYGSSVQAQKFIASLELLAEGKKNIAAELEKIGKELVARQNDAAKVGI